MKPKVTWAWIIFLWFGEMATNWDALALALLNQLSISVQNMCL